MVLWMILASGNVLITFCPLPENMQVKHEANKDLARDGSEKEVDMGMVAVGEEGSQDIEDKAACSSELTASCSVFVVRLRLFPTGGYNDLVEDKDDLRLHKSVRKVFGPSGQAARVARDNIVVVGAATKIELACLPASLPISTLSFDVAALGTFVGRVIVAALAPYESLHAQIDDMEAQVNERLKDLIMPDLAKFAESEEEDPFIDLLGEQPKARASTHERAIHDDSLNAPVTTNATVDIPGVITPQPVMPGSQA
ncbi:hypothetical protein HAX54_045030 [Datura stramonium]|uniref:Uncharacterized protein n=1 Tax=Datura stramonium TaxID=4076 RepID=A0ABS8SQ71_DATST|nr:hypothetical protein [Datura stramonium]